MCKNRFLWPSSHGDACPWLWGDAGDMVACRPGNAKAQFHVLGSDVCVALGINGAKYTLSQENFVSKAWWFQNKAIPLHTEIRRRLSGAVVQLVRILACHARGRGFESRPHRRGELIRLSFFCLSSHLLRRSCKRIRTARLPDGLSGLSGGRTCLWVCLV